jgi:hypothetical protein
MINFYITNSCTDGTNSVVKFRGGSDPGRAAWSNVTAGGKGAGRINQGEKFQIGVGSQDGDPSTGAFFLGFRMGNPSIGKGTTDGATFNFGYVSGANPYWELSGFMAADLYISIEITD